jgi:hemerythrin-like domain-containing protein
VNVLKELVEHHIHEEESEMFPIAKDLFTADELKELGTKMATRQRALAAGYSWDRSAVAAHSHA